MRVSSSRRPASPYPLFPVQSSPCNAAATLAAAIMLGVYMENLYSAHKTHILNIFHIKILFINIIIYM